MLIPTNSNPSIIQECVMIYMRKIQIWEARGGGGEEGLGERDRKNEGSL